MLPSSPFPFFFLSEIPAVNVPHIARARLAIARVAVLNSVADARCMERHVSRLLLLTSRRTSNVLVFWQAAA